MELETFGTKHQSYLITKHNLARCYQKTGEYETAIQLYKEVEEVRLETLGAKHDSYLTTKENMAFCYQEMYDYANITEVDIMNGEVSDSTESEWCEISMDMLET